MENLKKIKRVVSKKLFYSDIELLEVFQSALLIFVNPFNLSAIDCPECSLYLSYMCIPSLIIGILNITAIMIDCGISIRLRVARLHWVLCIMIMAVLTLCDKIHIGDGVLSYYLIQCIFCAFIIIRLNTELLHRRRRED